MKLRHHDIQIPIDGTDPFINCKLERKQYAEVLTSIVSSYNDGFVLVSSEDMIEKGTIEIAPLAYMRGRTLESAYVILDEAQNTTTNQMKLFLTRLGFNSKMVVTGDITQIDLPKKTYSGLVQAVDLLNKVD